MDKNKLKAHGKKSYLNDKKIENIITNHPNFNINSFLPEKKIKSKQNNLANSCQKTHLNNKFNNPMHMKKGKLIKEFQLPNIPIKDKKIISPIKITAANKNPIINNINISNNNINIKNISISSEKNKNQKNPNPINISEKNKSSTTQKFIKIQNKIPNGLTNEGKPLFMNAILQCFANIKNLTEKILSYSLEMKTKSNMYKYQVSKVYAEILENLWINKNKSFSPAKIKNIFLTKNNINIINSKVEPNELVSFLLDNLYLELNKTTQNKNMINSPPQKLNFSSTMLNYFDTFQKNYKSIISDLFYGGLKFTMTCSYCNSSIIKTSTFKMLIFPLQKTLNSRGLTIIKALNIYDCFKYSQFYENIKKPTKLCNTCHKICLHFNLTKIIYTPRIMIIDLFRENNSNIKFKLEEFIDIKDYTIYKEEFPTYYELIGAVNLLNYYGNSKIKYIAFCKNFNNQNWYKYDDTNIFESSFLEVSNNGIPCILFYSYIKR